MEYKKNYRQVMERLDGLFSGQCRDQVFARMSVHSPVLERYSTYYPEGDLPYPSLEERRDFWNSFLSEQTELLDDSMPVAYMAEFDEGLYTALLGAPIRFQYLKETGRVCSMGDPILKEFSDWRSLKMDKECYWAKQYIKQLEFFKSDAQSKYGISHFIMIDGLNMLFELRGATNAYYDIMEHSEEIEEFFEFTRQINFWVQDLYFETIGLFEGGTFSNYGQWMPGRIVSESIDPFHMASPDYFEEWGRENAEKAISRYDGAALHIHHGNGRHLIHTASTIKGAKIITMSDEMFNRDKAYMHIEEIDKLRGDVPMIISIPYPLFIDLLDKGTLTSNIMYIVMNVPDVSTANRAMEKVIKYRR